MVATQVRGPLVSLGTMIDGRQTPTDGPDLAYQGSGFLDPRYSPANKDSQQQAIFPSFFGNSMYVLTDNVPSAEGTAKIAPAITAVSGTPLQFITVAPGNATLGNPSPAPSCPILPFQSSTVVNVMAIDLGFTSGTTTAGNATIASIPDTGVFTVGQWLVVGGAGNSAKTACQVCEVTSIVDSSHIVVSPAPAASLTGAPIGSANLFNTFPIGQSANAATPYWAAGEALFLNPAETVCRGVSISGSLSASGGTFSVVGYDVYGVKMTETIVHTGGATTQYGNKAFKYLVSVTPLFTDAHTYSVGLSDVYGFNLRSDKWEYVQASWNGSHLTGPQTSGWTQALQASAAPASATAADVRGTLQTSATGPSATGMSSTASDGGAVRLTLMMSIPLWNATYSNPNNTVPLFGYAQA